jgi:hypothetical protein
MNAYSVKIVDSRLSDGEETRSFDSIDAMYEYIRNAVVNLNSKNTGLDFDLIVEKGISKIIFYTHMKFGFTQVEVNEEGNS